MLDWEYSVSETCKSWYMGEAALRRWDVGFVENVVVKRQALKPCRRAKAYSETRKVLFAIEILPVRGLDPLVSTVHRTEYDCA